MDEKDIINRIKELCAIRDWTLYRLAKESGITYSTLCTMLHKSTSPSIPTLIKLCNGFGISLTDFFDTTNKERPLSKSEKDLLEKWQRLTPANQQIAEKYISYLISDQK